MRNINEQTDRLFEVSRAVEVVVLTQPPGNMALEVVVLSLPLEHSRGCSFNSASKVQERLSLYCIRAQDSRDYTFQPVSLRAA